ncbi:MAG: acetoacetate--CoA ligase [Devosiaceae bacterium]|nr:acetoacetate--CoA ligase [Devosiaceae bacterium]
MIKNTPENDVLWTPSEQRKSASALFKLSKNTSHLHGCKPDDYAGLHRWSIEQPEQFFSSLWDEMDIIGEKGERAFVGEDHIKNAKFFPDARLNYTQNLLRDPSDKIAIIATRDDGTRRQISRLELKTNVLRITKALRAAKIGPGDRIAGIVTNDIEAIEFYLASAAIGAIWASCSPDFGPAGASDRLNQVAPKLLVAVPDYRYGDKNIDITETINAVAKTKSVEQIVILGEVFETQKYAKPAFGSKQWLAPHVGKNDDAEEIDYNLASFDQPLVILFSSGTTGKPKCIIHRAGGLLLQHLKEHALHCDIGANDRLFYFSTCGWMMWNWQISSLALGTTLLTYDGNPFYPKPERLIDLIDEEQISVFGTSAKYIDALNKFGVKPKTSHDLKSLKSILSTGSPLLAPSFDYVYEDFKSDLHLASISGGTDICACFVGGVPTLPVRRGQIQGAMLGLDIVALDDNAKPIKGKAGELVCRTAFPSMPLGFWQDPDGTRYHKSYFSQIEGVWCQGDFLEELPEGGFIIHGRSDTVLNPGGVRIGTAEIYRQVEAIEQVQEAVAVGQDFEGDQRIVLFIRLVDGEKLSDELQKTIRKKIRLGATPRHVPAIIAAVPDIPRTRSGKISEIAVRDIIHGRKVKNTTALANAECLQFYADWAVEG